jgi:hypothetical protein
MVRAFQSIIQNIKVDITEIKEFTPSSTKKINEDLNLFKEIV